VTRALPPARQPAAWLRSRLPPQLAPLHSSRAGRALPHRRRGAATPVRPAPSLLRAVRARRGSRRAPAQSALPRRCRARPPGSLPLQGPCRARACRALGRRGPPRGVCRSGRSGSPGSAGRSQGGAAARRQRQSLCARPTRSPPCSRAQRPRARSLRTRRPRPATLRPRRPPRRLRRRLQAPRRAQTRRGPRREAGQRAGAPSACSARGRRDRHRCSLTRRVRARRL